MLDFNVEHVYFLFCELNFNDFFEPSCAERRTGPSRTGRLSGLIFILYFMNTTLVFKNFLPK